MTDTITLLGPMLMALLLIQILDSAAKIKLVLMVAIALGAAATYQSLDQLRKGNDDMIANYEEDTAAHLAGVGITPDSFEHMLYEHRLYSKDIRGFLTTSNSTGSFLIMSAFAAVALLIAAIKNHIPKASFAPITCCAISAAIVITGLAITQSKGAIAASIVGASMLAIYLIFGKYLARYKKTLVTLCVSIALLVSIAPIYYSLSGKSLPGGNSMLVRSQYWQGATAMYLDHPYTGVGGGNFASHYTRYKADGALETVQDPHNFILSILVQYGPLGLAAFLAALAIPLYKSIFPSPADTLPAADSNKKRTATLTVTTLLAIIAALLIVRPLVQADNLGTDLAVMLYVFGVLYIVPASIFILAFWLLYTGDKKQPTEPKTFATSITPAIFCAITAVALHNLIDFAIFEPGVLTLLFAMAAILAAINTQEKTLSPAQPLRFSIIAVVLISAAAYCHYTLIPPIKAGAKIQQAMLNPNIAAGLLTQAAKDDPYSSESLTLNGRMHLNLYKHSGQKQPQLLKRAEESFLAASKRDNTDYKNYAKLSEIFTLRAETASNNQNIAFKERALMFGNIAVEHYPGSGKLHFKAAKLAEELEDIETALKHYQRAVQIEDSYRAQFRTMYPGRKMFSRLGNDNYTFAKEKLAKLNRQAD